MYQQPQQQSFRPTILKMQANETVEAVIASAEGVYQEPRPPYNNVQFLWDLTINGQPYAWYVSDQHNQTLRNFGAGATIQIWKGDRGFNITPSQQGQPQQYAQPAGYQPPALQPTQQAGYNPPPPPQQPQQPQAQSQGTQRGVGGTRDFPSMVAAYMRAIKIAKFIGRKYDLAPEEFSINAAAYTLAQMANASGFDMISGDLDGWLPVLADDISGGDPGLFNGLSDNDRQVLESHFGRAIPSGSGGTRHEVQPTAQQQAGTGAEPTFDDGYGEFPPDPDEG